MATVARNSSATRKSRLTRKANSSPTQPKMSTLVLFVLGVVALIQVLPFYLGLVTSFKGSRDLGSVWALPFGGSLENYRIALDAGSVGRAILNSAIITVGVTVLVVLLGALAAYPLARRRTPFNQVVLLGTLAFMMIPPLSILVPLIRQLRLLGLLNSYLGLILVLTVLALPQAIFLYSQSMRSVPLSLEEAARIDGATSLRTFFSVVLPLMKPVTVSVIILTGTNAWNEFALSSYIMTSDATRPLAPAIAGFFGASGANINAAVAGSMMGVLPILIIYLFLQRYFMQGMMDGAVK